MRHRDHDPAPSLAVLFAVAAIILLGYRLVHADPAPAPDPGPVLVTAGASGWDDFAANGPFWGAILLAYAAVQTFISRQHWLAQGRLLAAITGLGLVLTAVIQWRFSGAPSSGIMTAIVAAVALVWHPTVKGAIQTLRSGSSLAAVAILAVALHGCSASARQHESSGLTAALDCEAPALAGTFASLMPIAGDAILNWITSDGKHIDHGKLKAALAPLEDKDAQLKCAITTALAVVTSPGAAAQPGAPESAGLEVDGPGLRAEFAAVRGELGWSPVVTRAGVL